MPLVARLVSLLRSGQIFTTEDTESEYSSVSSVLSVVEYLHTRYTTTFGTTMS